jgi:pyrroline-5-carboxylate reductase
MAARATEVTAATGIDAVDLAAAAGADVVVLAVKPPQIVSVCRHLAAHLQPSTVVVSVAAGIPLAAMEEVLPFGTPVVRVMPNTPLLVGQAMSVMSPGASATEEHLSLAEKLLGSVGRVVRLPESQMDAVTALSGSGPAYVFLLVESMVDAGVLLGLPRPIATELAVQTALGAATMLRETGEHPAMLREGVTSPGGTTAAALRELERGGLRAAVLAALEAARDRSRELANGG